MSALNTTPSSANTGTGKLSVLIADDEAPVLGLLGMMLKSFGHEVIAQAVNGQEAVQFAQEKKPDLVILDIGMPDMDGLTAAQQILARQSVPIIIVTGITREEVLDQAAGMEIQSFLIKPFSKEQLLAAIRLAMIRHHNTQQDKKKITELTNEIEITKTVNRAVELLIGKFGIDRSEAMEKLEAAAQARSCSVADAARAISATLGR